MKTKTVFFPALILAAFSLAATASAQQRRGDDERGRQREHAQPRQEAPRENGQQREAEAREQARHGNGQPQQAQSRARADSVRGMSTRHGEGERDNRRRENARPRIARYRPYYYARPYYVFRPRLSLGYGFWLGYPVPYPYYGYAYPYGPGNAYPDDAYGYPAPPPNAVDVAPGQAYGGLSFDMTPSDAAVYIDGEYAGIVGDFTPNAQPLTVGPGQHRLQIEAPGYAPMVFDVNVEAGQVMPFRGALRPY